MDLIGHGRRQRRSPHGWLCPSLAKLILVGGALLTLTAAANAQSVACLGDCNGDGEVTVNELITAINIVLGNASASACPALDCPDIDVGCLIGAVNNALLGCPVEATPSATSSHGPSASTTPEVTDTPTPPVTSTPTNPEPLTDTPTPSVSPTAVATRVGSASPSATLGPSRSPTPNPSPTLGSSGTATRTATTTRTPSQTWSPTLTVPPTRTPTSTTTRTATRTRTVTPTVTRTPTITLTRTATITATVTLTPTASTTATATLQPTPTLPIVPGPQITFFGLATASNHLMTPIALSPDAAPIYQPLFGSGFIIVVESKSGSSGKAPGLQTLNSDPNNPAARPDIQIEADHNLGNGSAAICDVGPAPDQPIGGVPGIDPPSFDPTSQTIADALNDFGCRFDSHTAGDPCTLNANDNPALVASDTTTQFCTGGVVGREVEFQQGDTLLTVQWRDSGGNLSLAAHIIVRVP